MVQSGTIWTVDQISISADSHVTDHVAFNAHTHTHTLSHSLSLSIVDMRRNERKVHGCDVWDSDRRIDRRFGVVLGRGPRIPAVLVGGICGALMGLDTFGGMSSCGLSNP